LNDERGSDNRSSGSQSDQRTSASQVSGPVEAIVKWFNAEKGVRRETGKE